MKIIRRIEEIDCVEMEESERKFGVVIGNFDGVHSGHQ